MPDKNVNAILAPLQINACMGKNIKCPLKFQSYTLTIRNSTIDRSQIIYLFILCNVYDAQFILIFFR